MLFNKRSKMIAFITNLSVSLPLTLQWGTLVHVYTHTGVHMHTHTPMCAHRHATLASCFSLSSLFDSVNRDLCNTSPSEALC